MGPSSVVRLLTVWVAAGFARLLVGGSSTVCWLSCRALRFAAPERATRRGSGIGEDGGRMMACPELPGLLDPEYCLFTFVLGGFMNSGELPKGYLDVSGVLSDCEGTGATVLSG